MALAGICELPDPPPPVVAAVDDELVELQAIAVVAISMTIPNAAMRVFHDPEPKAPP
jgi:hypothetical protein